MSHRTIDLLVSLFLFIVGIGFSVASLTWASDSVIWFFDEFEGSNPDLVMEKVVAIATGGFIGVIAHYCIKRAIQVWQTIP